MSPTTQHNHCENTADSECRHARDFGHGWVDVVLVGDEDTGYEEEAYDYCAQEGEADHW